MWVYDPLQLWGVRLCSYTCNGFLSGQKFLFSTSPRPSSCAWWIMLWSAREGWISVCVWLIETEREQEKEHLCVNSPDVCEGGKLQEDQSHSLTVLIQDEGSPGDSQGIHTVVHHAAGRRGWWDAVTVPSVRTWTSHVWLSIYLSIYLVCLFLFIKYVLEFYWKSLQLNFQFQHSRQFVDI